MDVSKIVGTNLNSVATKMTVKKDNPHDNKPMSQANRDKNDSGVEISISNESRMRQSSRLPKLTIDNTILDGRNIDELKAAIKGEVSWDNFVEFTDSSLVVDRTGGKLLITPDDSQSEKYRKELLNVTSLYGRIDGAVGSSDEFNAVSTKYMDLRKGIEEKYSNDELAEQLKLLDESYDTAINTIAEHATFAVRSSAKIYEMSVKANNTLVKHGQTHGHTFGIPVKDKVEYDKDAFDKSVNTLVQNIQNSIKNFGALAKQYMLDGNNPTDKNAFEAYISHGVDESKGLYSLDDVDMLKSIFDPIGGKGAKSNLYSALEKLEKSGISDNLKAAIVRMTTQTDKMFSVVSDDNKESNDKLSELMLKWEKQANYVFANK